MPRSGDPCPECPGRLKVRTSRPKTKDYQWQQLRCPECGYSITAVIPAIEVWRRKSNVVSDNTT